ncbi:unnamed protein product [Caenorhabditis angaria]|uniref:Uncharacterized protein n=1 Tax=Caenorhabditis angaria TaxID=860376 RepID=A0A9P1ICW9_9PELO|nr:unnamed protein product [Caenorhabditis angaria]
MSVIFAFMLLQWFESLTAKLLMSPYLTGLKIIGDNPSQIKLWWTSDISKMIPIASMSSDVSFFIGGFFQWHYILSLANVLFIFAVERSFACCFISDYEQTPRNYLLVLILFFYHSFVLLMTYTFFYATFHFAIAFSFCMFPNVFASIMFLYTENYNKKIIDRFETSPTQYTLASRFQARENYKAQKLVTRVIICAIAMMTLGLCLVLILTLEVVPVMDTFINYLVDNIVHLNPLIVCPIFIWSVPSWKLFIRKHLPILFNRMNRRVNVRTPPSTNIDLKWLQLNQETDTYFKQLESAWH